MLIVKIKKLRNIILQKTNTPVVARQYRERITRHGLKVRRLSAIQGFKSETCNNTRTGTSLTTVVETSLRNSKSKIAGIRQLILLLVKGNNDAFVTTQADGVFYISPFQLGRCRDDNDTGVGSIFLSEVAWAVAQV